MPYLDLNAELERKPETADPYEDLGAISARIDRVLETDRWSHQLFESGWFRNILMIAGAQWIIKDRNGRWQRKSVPFIGFPRTYTNKVAEVYTALVSQLVQGKKIPLSCQPADPDDQADVGIAEIGESLIDLIRTEAEEDENQHAVASWLVATGNCFGIANYDLDDRFGVAKVPYQTCADCGAGPFAPKDLAESNGACPECGSKNLQPAQTPEGDAIVDTLPRGAIQIDVCGPFEIRLDHRVQNYKQLRRFIRQRRYDLDWAKEHWGDQLDPDSIVPDSGDSDPGQYYLDVISNVSSAYRFGAGLFSNSANATGRTPKVTAYEFYELPSEDFPDGIKAVRLGSSKLAIVDPGPLPTKYGAGVKEGQYFLPLVHWGYSKVPGRFWYKTPLDDVIPLQITRNVIEANINITVQRMGNPVWLNPKGSGVDILTGESGQVIQYNPMAVGGTTPVKPERIPAELNNLGPLIGWMQRVDDAIERVSGTYYLQNGTAPPGVTAASALALLSEKGQQSLSSVRAAWAEAWTQFYLFGLEIARENWDESRIRVVAGKNRKWQATKFAKADLQGSLNIIIDYNALAPKSMATEQAKIAQLTQLGMVNPADEKMRIEVLKRFGALDLTGAIDKDIQYAAKVQDHFLQDQTYIPVVRPLIDNATVLMGEAVSFAKTDEYDELPPERQETWLEYCKNLALDIATRRLALTQAGIDPDVPATAEIPSGEAQAGAQAAQQAQQAQAAAQSGGVPSGAEGPDPRLDAQGNALPGSELAPNAAIPDIGGSPEDYLGNASPAGVKPPGSPRTIPLPPGEQ